RASGGTTTVQQLKAAASRAGVGNADLPLRALMQPGFVLLVSPGITKHELWRAHSAHYGWQGDPRWEVTGVPSALALANPNIQLPPLSVGPYAAEPAAVE